jgi:hypothetical protein
MTQRRTRSLVSRRSLLQRLGGAAFLAVPVFRGALAEAQATSPQRFLVVHYPGGARYITGNGLNEWSITAADHNFNFNKVLSPLSSLRSDIVTFEQIGDPTRPAAGQGGHSTPPILTGESRWGNEDQEEAGTYTTPGTTSIDQVIANHISQTTRFSSLQLGVRTEGKELTLSQGRIVFANGARVAPVNDAAVVFSRLFSGSAPPPSSTGEPPPTMTPEDAAGVDMVARLAAQKKSIFDLRQAELNEIRAIAGSAEHSKLDEHLTAIRELEKNLPVATQPGGGSVPGGGGGGIPPVAGTTCAPPGLGTATDLPTQIANMNELAYQAINCDLTRVVTIQWLTSGADDTFSFVGVSRGHHEMQHDARDDFDTAQTWFMSQAASLIQRFKSTPDGDKTLLSNSAFLVLSEQSYSHCATPVLGFLAGQAGGNIQTGGVLRGNQSSLNDLHIGIARAFGININTFGEAKWVKSPLSLG